MTNPSTSISFDVRILRALETEVLRIERDQKLKMTVSHLVNQILAPHFGIAPETLNFKKRRQALPNYATHADAANDLYTEQLRPNKYGVSPNDIGLYRIWKKSDAHTQKALLQNEKTAKVIKRCEQLEKENKL